MRIVIYISTVVLLLCSLAITLAQDTAEDETSIHVDQRFPQSLSGEAERFLDDIQLERLNPNSVHLSTETNPPFDASISLIYEARNSQDIRLTVQLEQPDRLSPSPILSPFFWSPTRSAIQFSHLEVPAIRAMAADYITGLSLYVVGRCGQAGLYFTEAEHALEASGDDAVSEPQLLRDALDIYRANCALVAGDYPTASRIYEAHLHYVSPAINLAWIYLQTEQELRAFEILENLIDDTMSRDTKAFALRRRAQLYALAFYFDLAITDIDSAIELDPHNPELYVERGNIIMLLYEWDRVRESYNTAIELNATYADAYFRRGILYYSLLERERALADFERYLRLAPQGEHAGEASDYADSIRSEIQALQD